MILGPSPFGVSRELFTFHTQRLYITVLVWNHAGLETLVSGGPYVVDFTPPELTEGGRVWDGDYQNTTVLQADWSDIVDPESGIEECAFMIGNVYMCSFMLSLNSPGCMMLWLRCFGCIVYVI